MQNDHEIVALLTELRDLSKEHIQLYRQHLESSKQIAKQAEEATTRSIQNQELAIARSQKNWLLYKLVVASFFLFLVALTIFIFRAV